MARRGLLGGLLTVTTAAAAVAGVCYLFKEEIKGTKTYKDLDEKYDVDNKIKEYSNKAKTTAYDLKDKAKVAAKDLKAKGEEWKASNDDTIFEDDEIIIDGGASESRDYVSIKSDDISENISEVAEDLKESASDKVEEIKDTVADKAEDAKEEVADKVEETKEAVADKVDDIKDSISDKAEDIKDIADNIADNIEMD